MTDAEQRLWYHLRLRQLGGYKFRRQQVIGPYIVDFVCLEERLIVDVDGGQHDEQAAKDAERTAWLESQEFRVIRFWNTEVFFQVEDVCDEIYRALEPNGEDTQGDPPS
jgi:very-short-patch-repair endonuclease